MLACSFRLMKSQSIKLQKLAEKLIEAKTESVRKFLLKDVPKTDFLKLAQALRDTYYESWTNEPKRVQKAAQALKSLVKNNPGEEIKALSFWVSGIADLTQGKLSSAIENLDKSSQTFQIIDKEYESAQTQVAKLYALGLLGQYKKAFECGKTALEVFEKYGDEIAAGKIENNIGNLFIRQELLREAENYYLAARSRFAKLKNTEQLVLCEIGLANTYSSLNDFRKAEKLYHRTLYTAQKTGMFLRQAEIETNIGSLALYRGKYDKALKFLENSRQKYETLKMPHQTTIAELEIADAYLELNLVKEAYDIYKTIGDKLHRLKMQGEEARARANFGRSAATLNKLQIARKQLKKAARLYILEKNNVGAATVKIAQANLELTQKNYRAAWQTAEEIENLLADSENLRHKLSARFIKAEALRNLGEHTKSAQELRSVYTDAVKFEQPNTAQAAQIALGKIAFYDKNFRQAEKHFKSAIRLTETLRAPLAAEEFRMAFLADKLAPFEYLTKIYLAENKIEKAFLMTEQSRSRSLAENLNGGFGADGKTAGVLGNKLTILREELNWFYSRLSRAADSEIKKLQVEANSREKQISAFMRQIAATHSNRAEIVANRTSTGKQTNDEENLRRTQKQIGKKKALIEFVNLESRLAAFIVTDKKISFVADLATEAEVLTLLESLQFQFGALRYGAKNLGNFAAELKKRADFYLGQLYDKLLAPLEHFLEKRHLTIVPVGATHYVPFHALFDGEHYMIEKGNVTYAPSATVWRFLASKRLNNSDNALLIGYADERIPLVNREIETLQKIFRTAQAFTGDQANIAAFTENAPRFDVLHLACHGQFRPENPMFSSLHLADGRLTVRDIGNCKLKAKLVVLSACETGLNKIFAGEEILGLARGFLSAGAKSLVLSLWTVSDEATTELMKEFYERRKTGKSAAESLRIAQRGFIERGAHPYFWSPFLIIGK